MRIVSLIASIVLLAPSAWGAFGSVGDFLNANSKVSESSKTFTVTGTLTAGNAGVLVIGVDNESTTDGNTTLCTTVTDSGSNTWTKRREFTNGQGAANAGATVCLFTTVAGTTLTSGSGTVTINLAVAKTAKAVTGWSFTITPGNVLSLEGTPTDTAYDGISPGNVTSPTVANREHLFFWAGAVEASVNPAGACTSYTSLTLTNAVTTGGASASNMGANGMFRILTATSDSCAPTMVADDDWATTYLVINEDAPAGGAPKVFRRIFKTDNRDSAPLWEREERMAA